MTFAGDEFFCNYMYMLRETDVLLNVILTNFTKDNFNGS